MPDFKDELRAVTDELVDLLSHKNECYGDSALNPVRIFSRASVADGIAVRIDDKLSRIARGQDAGEDAELDLLGYLILRRVAKARETGVVGPQSGRWTTVEHDTPDEYRDHGLRECRTTTSLERSLLDDLIELRERFAVEWKITRLGNVTNAGLVARVGLAARDQAREIERLRAELDRARALEARIAELESERAKLHDAMREAVRSDRRNSAWSEPPSLAELGRTMFGVDLFDEFDRPLRVDVVE